MHRVASILFLLLSFSLLAPDSGEAQRRRRRDNSGAVNAGRFEGGNVCQRIQAAIDAVAARGGTVVADAAGDCGATTQVRVRSGVTLRLPPGTFTYSMRGYGGTRQTGAGAKKMIGALFLLDSDSTLEGSGPETVIRESSWVYTDLAPDQQRHALANGEHIAGFKVILTYATAVANGSTARNVTVRNLKLARGKPDGPGTFNSAGAALEIANCHNCLIENVHLERTRSIGIQVGGQASGGQDPGADLVERGVREPLGRFAQNVTVRNCVFTAVASQNLALVNGRNITFDSNRFLAQGQQGGPGSTAIDVEPNHHLDYLENVTISNNVIDARGADRNVTGNGIVVQATTGTTRVGPVLIENNEVIGGNIVPPRITNKISNGIYVFGRTMQNVTIRNNRVTRTGQSGIRIEGKRFTVVNNQFKDIGGGGIPGFVLAGVSESRIEGNVFTYSGKGPTDPRIILQSNSRNNVIRDNRGFAQPVEKP